MCEGFSEHSSVQSDRVAAGGRRRRMAPELIERTVRDAVPHGLREIIPSTMGEPLMYRDFDVFLQLCREFAPRLKLNLTTNGSFPSNGVREGVVAWATALLPVLSDVKFSWNAATKATQERVMKRASFDKQLANLRTFLRMRDDAAALGANRASVTLQLTFMAANAPEFPALIKLAAELGVDRVKGHHLWTHWAAMEDQGMRRSAEAAQRWNAIAAECRAVAAATPRLGGGRVALQNFGNLDVDDAASKQVPPDAACPFLGNELWVNSRGRIDPCCAPDAERALLGSFGDVQRPGGVMAAWSSPQYRALMSTYAAHPVCGRCNMRKA
jgi:MoaA/NifB/PqqE/SkfB family radical SAM enzyme